jgi:hypothetical protein
LASTNHWLTMPGNPDIRPNLSSAVASEDKEKPHKFFFGLSFFPLLEAEKAGDRSRQPHGITSGLT